jgi:hypothetical protein
MNHIQNNTATLPVVITASQVVPDRLDELLSPKQVLIGQRRFCPDVKQQVQQQQHSKKKKKSHGDLK